MAESKALQYWRKRQSLELDRLEAAHKAVGGVKPGKRHTTQQIDDAFVVLLSAHFQQFCRDLHSEASSWLANQVTPTPLRLLASALLTQDRKLDRVNAQPSSIGSDFS